METPTTPVAGRRRGPLIASAAVAVVILVGVAVVLALTGDDSDNDVSELGAPGEQADVPPPVTGESDIPADGFEYWDGSPGTLRDFGGQPVVLNFFASWCAPCVEEMPDFETVHQELGDQVRFVGVNRPDQPEAAERIIDQTGITYEVVRDHGTLLESLEGLVMPTTVLITADGRIVRLHSGPMDAEQLRNAIDEELLT
jgi:thiol-disulfide isomerase/thioredoxin